MYFVFIFFRRTSAFTGRRTLCDVRWNALFCALDSYSKRNKWDRKRRGDLPTYPAGPSTDKS